MKRTLLSTIFFLALAFPAWAITTYNATSLTGGTSRALDYLSVDDLSNGDRAIVDATSGSSPYFYIFRYVSTGTTAEGTSTHPYYVRPDDYATAGVWEEVITAYAYAGSHVEMTDLVVSGTFTVGSVEASGALSGSLPITDLKNNTTHTLSGVSREGGTCSNWLDTSGTSGTTAHVGDGTKGDSFIVSLDRSTQVGSGSGNTIWVTFAVGQTVLEDTLFTAGTSCYELSGVTGDTVTGICVADDVWKILTAGSPTETNE